MVQTIAKMIRMTKVPFIDLNRQHEAIKGELYEAIQRVVSSGNFILGAEVEGFEREFAAYTGAEHCVTCANGTDALELAFEALNIKPGDEVILPAFGWVSASMALKRMGAVPVYVDIHPGTFHITVAEIEPAITSKTKAVVIVHLFGQANEVYEVSRLCKQKGLLLIEDCAQAHGLFIDGKKHVGNFGDIGTFSFYPTKNLGCLGDGGGIITNDSAIADKVRALRDYGRVEGEFTIDGRNSRMDELQAAILKTKLTHLDAWNNRRKEVARRYNQVLADKVETLPPLLNNVFYRYVIRIDSDEINSVSSRFLAFEVAERLSSVVAFEKKISGSIGNLNSLFILPISPELTENEINYICQSL